MKVLSLVCCLALASLGTAAAQTPPAAKPTPKAPAAKSPAAAAKGARTIEISGGDNMKFDKTEITARPGETVRVVFKNIGTMPKAAMGHNFVVLKLGVDQVEFNTAAFNARETDFIPPAKKADVLAHTALSGPGETVEVTFKVPAKAGSYPYLCSFPGHFALGMRGMMIVK
jgi:azurin